MNNNRLSLLLPFFKGDSLESEFGFVNYYHSHSINRLLHTIAIPLLIFGILTIIGSINYYLAVVFCTLYCTIICLFDYKTALAYIILFIVLFDQAIIFSSQGTNSILYGSIIFFLGLSMQGLGHYKFQKYAPAFRLFEAIFTTPTFLMMYLINDHNQPFWNNVKKETIKWKEILNK